MVSSEVDSTKKTINMINPELIIEIHANKEEVSLGDIILYRISLINSGNIDLKNIIVRSKLPLILNLINGTIKVNKKSISHAQFNNGINVGFLCKDNSIEIKYEAKVVGGSCSGFIFNCASVEYEYISKNGEVKKGILQKVSKKTICNISFLKQIIVEKYCVLSNEKYPIHEIDNTIANVYILKKYVIKNNNGINNEGQNLSGYKLIIQGILKVNIEYTTGVNEYSIHSEYYDIPFGSYIILPQDYKANMNMDTLCKLEHIDTIMIDSKKIYLNILLLLEANIK